LGYTPFSETPIAPIPSLWSVIRQARFVNIPSRHCSLYQGSRAVVAFKVAFRGRGATGVWRDFAMNKSDQTTKNLNETNETIVDKRCFQMMDLERWG